HFALGSFLLAYFPFSKLMHAGGIFLSPTRNMPNNNRAERHVNPWNPPYKGITWQEYYEAYKDQLDEIAESGYKVKPEVM
ncbi:MAG: menaquinol oxidoreductase, partial [Archaeoglobaceae archaeon]